MRLRATSLILGLLLLAGTSASSRFVADETKKGTIPDSKPATAEQIKTAVTKALPLLQKGAEGHIAQRTCFACHNQALPVLALTAAREKDFELGQWDVKKQLEFIAGFMSKNRDNFRKGKGTGGQADTAGYALFTLELGGWQPDATTEAMVEYLLQRDQERGHWRNTSNRPPSEASPFTTTYLALRAIHKWGTAEHKDRVAKRTESARAWLVRTPPKDTEDRVFRLLGLRAANAAEKDWQAARQELVKSQRADGGWSQTDTLDSDSYATGSALVALHQAGGMTCDDPVYQRGVTFLCKTQQADGSWVVRSRSRPFQAYYESGFPHGKDQFISIAASGWATTALVLTTPPPASTNK